tara:strand:+ start:3117 stop:3506 length:390 start_codon:yes stop_codon:yes gene_type:complete
MKNTTTLLFFLLLAFSCTKKEVQKEKQEVLDPILKDTIVQIDYESKEEVSKLVFTVQIAALRNSNERFANIGNVSLYQENSLTKYRLGAFETYKEAREFRLKVSNEYKGAFVQALKNNVPISITEALQQ